MTAINICEWTFSGFPRCTRPAIGKANGTVPICRECAQRANVTPRTSEAGKLDPAWNVDDELRRAIAQSPR